MSRSLWRSDLHLIGHIFLVRVEPRARVMAFCGLMLALLYSVPVMAQPVGVEREPDRTTTSRFRTLNRQSRWELVSRQQLAFETLFDARGSPVVSGRNRVV